MPHSDPTQEFSPESGGGGDDDGSDFFDDDTDFSTDIEGESLDDRADVSSGGGDDDDDDDDRTDRTGRTDRDDDDRGGVSAPPGVSGPLDEGPEPAPGAPQEGQTPGESTTQTSTGDGDDDGGGATQVPDDDGSADQTGDITETAVTGSSLEAVRRAAEEQFPEAEGFDIRKTAGVGDRARFEVEARLGDETEQRTVFVDQGEIRRGLEEEEARLESETGRDVRIVDTGGETQAEFADSDEERRINQEARRDARADAIENVLQQVEAQVGRQRAERRGFGDQFFAPAGTPGTSEGGRQLDDELAARFADLERGEDVILDVQESDEGISVDAELSEDFRRQEALQAAAAQVERQTKTPIDPEKDLQFEESGEVTLTEQGAAQVATQPLSDLVREIEERTGIESPIEGPILERIDRNRDLGQRDIPLRPNRLVLEEGPLAGAFPGAEFIGAGVSVEPTGEKTTFEEALNSFEESIIQATADQGAAVESMEERPGRAGAALRTERRAFTGEGRTPVAQASESALRGIPLFLSGGVKLAKDTVEFGGAATEAAVTGDFERVEQLGEDLAGATKETAVLTAATAADDPGEFAARGAGSVIASGPLFAGARAIGSGASLATRGLVQPGEEIAGIGGHAVTRRVAGSGAAQKLFPDQEPLIFSEEAAIRNIAKASRGIREKAAAAKAMAATEATGARFRAAELDPRTDVEARPLTQNIRRRIAEERKALEFRAAELDPRQDPRFPDPGEVEFVEEAAPAGLGAVARVESRTESETLQDFESESEEGFATRQETREQVEQPEVDAGGESTAGGRRVETALNEEDILSEVRARAIAAEVSELRQRGLVEPSGEQTGELDVGQELDPELEQLLEQELEGEQEGEFEAEGEFEGDLEQELIKEAEAEAEQELEFEGDVEQEPEVETETQSDLDPSELEKKLLEETDPFAEERFESGILAGEAEFESIEDEILGASGGSNGGEQSIEDIEREILKG